MFSYSKSMETIGLRGMAKFDPRGMIGTIFNEDYQTLTIYKIQKLCALWFQRRRFFFFVFPIVSLWGLSIAMETTILMLFAPNTNAINPPTL